MTYEVIAVDQFGYRSNPRKVGTVKISHDGSHDKTNWTVTTNMTSDLDKMEEATEEDPCAPEKTPAIQYVIDNDYSKNTYTGKTGGNGAAILLNLHEVLEVSGLKYTIAQGNPVGDYVIEVSTDGSKWTTVKIGTFENKKGSQTVYFENEQKDPWICTYDAAYVRIKTNSPEMTVTELDLLGPTGDNVSFGTRPDSTTGAVGRLKEAYVYEQNGGEKKSIPEGSLIFTGSYKGNPAYNVVVLYDENGNVVGGTDSEGVLTAEQIILARVPENGALGEVSDGIWIYWIAPDEQGELPKITGKVRAELYRVDNAMTNEGQRLVSDTLPLQMPDKLDSIVLKGGQETE